MSDAATTIRAEDEARAEALVELFRFVRPEYLEAAKAAYLEAEQAAVNAAYLREVARTASQPKSPPRAGFRPPDGPR